MDSDKKEFGKWWMWTLALIVITVIVLAGLRVGGVIGERVVFENSYQYHEARKTEIATYEAQLAEINRILSSNIDDSVRVNLEAQASAIRINLSTARSK